MLAFASVARGQVVLAATNTTTDTVVAFSPVDGSLISSDVIPVEDLIQVSAIAVGFEIWVSEQIGDRIVRYDHGGNVLGVIGPTFAGGGFDNIRGLKLIGSTVYVANSDANNGATADSLVLFDTAGNHLSTIALTNTESPYSVMPWQGDILVSTGLGAAATDDVHRYTLAGVSVGTFNNSSLSFVQQISQASDGNVWAAVFSSNVVVKLDATTGATLLSFPASGARGVFELQNGNVMWGGSAGAHVYNVGTGISTLVLAGTTYSFDLLPTDVSFHRSYGTGCYSFTVDHSNLFELFASAPLAKAALDGNALLFTMTGTGYSAEWFPFIANSIYFTPTGAATIVADVSTGTETFTPSVAIPIPGGAATIWTVSSEGILTAGAPGNQGTDTTPTLAETAAANGVAFYTWCTQSPTEAGSGKISWEEDSNWLYVTFNGVEFSGGTPTIAPSTYQWQIHKTTGNVIMLWTSFSASSSTSDVLVGCTLAGAGITPVSQTLSTAVGHVIFPDEVLLPLTLSAFPPPVINPSTPVTYTIDNVPETAPGSGLHLSALLLSVAPLPGGFDLAGFLTVMPGCSTYVGSWDVITGLAVTATPTNPVGFTFSTPTFAPGNAIGVQAVALFDAAFPLLNGENGGFVFSNGVLSTTFVQ